MDIIGLLIKASRVNVLAAIAGGLLSGGCSAGLIALINNALSPNAPASSMPLFIGLVLIALLVISHDNYYFHLADRIIRLNYGQIESDTATAQT